MRRGKKSAAQTPAPKSDRIYGSKQNVKGSAKSSSSAKSIILSDEIINVLKDKQKEYNSNHNDKVTLATLKAVFRRGAGAYSKSHRPTITGGAPNSRTAWSYARVNKFLQKKAGKKVKKAYIQDDDLMEKGGLIAINGKPSNLTPTQYKLVRTPEFKAWFGDWENDPQNASKVVDENGEPLVVYHGSNKKLFTQFKNYFERKKLAIPNDRIKLHFFTNDRNAAKDYGTKNIYECFLSMKNPLYYQTSDGTPEQAIFQQNKDGFILESSTSVFAVPKSNQIKLADGTNTTFDIDNQDIRYANGGKTFNDKELSSKIINLKKNGIVIKDLDNTITLIAYNTGNQNRDNALYNKALIYRSIPPLRQANEMIVRFDNKDYENFDESKIDEYKKNHLIIVNQNEIVFDSNKVAEYMRKGGKIFNDTELLAKWKKGESIGFTGEAHLKAKGLIPRADGHKRKSEKYMEKGGELNQEIICVNCGWNWNTTDSDDSDKYVCHKCGFDNTLYYSNDIMGKQDFDGFADKRLQGAEKITNDSKEKGGLSLLTYYHYNVKLPFYEEATKGGFDLQKAKEQFKKYYSELSYNMEQVEFQELMGKMEVLGELIIQQENQHSLKIAMKKQDEFKEGGVVVGKRHSESDENGSGEKFLVESTGQVVELEGGEAVLTKESMESENKFSFDGKKMTGREIASFLNHKYGGVEFKEGGQVDSVSGCNTKYYHGGELPTATVDSLKGGEAVITVKTMESRDKYNFNNRSLTPRQILSIINEKSGGKKFERGGILNTNMKDLTKMVYFTEKVLYS